MSLRDGAGRGPFMPVARAIRITASSYLRELEKAGFVRAQKAGTERLFINYRLVDLLAQTD